MLSSMSISHNLVAWLRVPSRTVVLSLVTVTLVLVNVVVNPSSQSWPMLSKLPDWRPEVMSTLFACLLRFNGIGGKKRKKMILFQTEEVSIISLS